MRSSEERLAIPQEKKGGFSIFKFHLAKFRAVKSRIPNMLIEKEGLSSQQKISAE